MHICKHSAILASVGHVVLVSTPPEASPKNMAGRLHKCVYGFLDVGFRVLLPRRLSDPAEVRSLLQNGLGPSLGL